MGYEETFHRFLQGIMSDVERRIRRGHERLALNAKKEQVSTIFNTFSKLKLFHLFLCN